MKYLKIIILVVVSLFLYNNPRAQSYTNVSGVISSSGGLSSGGNYSNFEVLAETFVMRNITGGNYMTHIGFLQAVDCVPVGISKIIYENSLSIYPNPTSGLIRLRDYKNDIEIISVRNIYGDLILLVSDTDYLDLSFFPSGVYFLNIVLKGNQSILISKIVKI